MARTRISSHGFPDWAVLACIVVAASSSHVAATPRFRSPFLSYDVGHGSNALVVGDLNADGRPDLVVSDDGTGTVSVLLGTGDGTFQEALHFPCGGSLRSLVAADVNSDSRLDLAVADETFGTFGSVAVLLGNGDGTLGPRQDFVTRRRPVYVTSGDWNRDGWPDLVTADQESSMVSILLGHGDGTFGPAAGLASGYSPIAVAGADLDGDGSEDLVVANATTFSVLLGRGDGTFGARTDYPSGPFSRAIAAGDVSGDGRPDVVVTSIHHFHEYSNSSVTVWLNDGDGNFARGQGYGASGAFVSVAVKDLDHDGHADLAVADEDWDYSTVYNHSRLLVLPGLGDGSFGTARGFATGGSPRHLAVADLDSDDQADVAVACWGGLSVLLGSGDNLFETRTEFPTFRLFNGVAIGDLNGDGFGDLVVTNGGGRALAVALGDRETTVGTWSILETDRDHNFPLLTDVNGDSWLDLVTANIGARSISIFLGKGDGSFEPGSSFETGMAPVSMTTGDLNGDGKIDLAIGSPAHSVSILLGNGDGTFATAADVESEGYVLAIVAGDLTGDGNLDLAVSSQLVGSAGRISVWRGNGDGTFTTAATLDMSYGTEDVTMGDLDGDGRIDLLAVVPLLVAPYSTELWMWSGDGQGGFQPGIKLRSWRYSTPAAVATTDLDLDGTADIAVASSRANTVSVLPGTGDGSFPRKLDFGTGGSPTSMAVGDLNADRRPDLVLTTPGSATVTVLLNLAGSTPVLVEDLIAETASGRVRLGWRLSAEAQTSLTAIQVQRAEDVGGRYVEVTHSPIVPERDMSFEDADVELGRDYWYRLVLLDSRGIAGFVGPVRARLGTALPRQVSLSPPFVPEGGGPVQIRYAIGPSPVSVVITIHDVRGRRLWSSLPQLRPAGEHVQTWDRRDAEGKLAPRGIFFVTLRAGSARANTKLVLIDGTGDSR